MDEQSGGAGGPPPPPSAWEQPRPASLPGAPGYVFADVPNRFIALIIDGIVLIVILAVIGIVLGIAGLSAGFGAMERFDAVASAIYSVIGLIASAGYFLYGWTRMRTTVGMRMLGMQVGNAFDGKTLTTEQAVKRWIALWGPSTVSAALTGIPIIGLIVFFYLLYLLYTTATSPTKQGFHDTYANTVVVKATRVA